jgi:hypothetical protein
VVRAKPRGGPHQRCNGRQLRLNRASARALAPRATTTASTATASSANTIAATDTNSSTAATTCPASATPTKTPPGKCSLGPHVDLWLPVPTRGKAGHASKRVRSKEPLELGFKRTHTHTHTHAHTHT